MVGAVTFIEVTKEYVYQQVDLHDVRVDADEIVFVGCYSKGVMKTKGGSVILRYICDRSFETPTRFFVPTNIHHILLKCENPIKHKITPPKDSVSWE